MRRRALLGSAAGLLSAGLAGCLGDPGGSGTTSSPGTTSTDPGTTEYHGTDDDLAETTTFEASVSVELERLQPAVLVMGIDSVGVRSEGSQYLYYRVDVTDGDPPERTAFGFRYGGQVVSPGLDLGDGPTLWRDSETDDRYTAERGEGWLVFELPADQAATHAALALGNEEWPVGDAVRERLEAPAPELDLDWDVPEEQPAGESTLGFTVTNDSDLDTWFVGGLNAIEIRAAHSPVAGVRREVPAGETVSWEVTHDNGREPDDDSVGDGEPDGTYALDWAQGDLDQEVYFVAETTDE